jgi:signal peptidase I
LTSAGAEKQDESTPKRQWVGLLSHPTLRRLLLLLVIVLTVREFVWSPVLITGKSMLPTLHGGQIVFVNKLAYFCNAPRRGDIVAIWTGKELMIKRVVGLPGDEISATNGFFCINGSPLREPYVQIQDRWNIAPGTVSADRFVVAGDNRSGTLVAIITRERVVGRLMR